MVAEIKPVNAAGMPAPVAPYSNAVRAKASEFLFIAGQVALDAAGHVVGVGDLEAQARQTFANIELALKGAGTGFDSIVQFTTYLVRASDIPAFAEFRRRMFPTYFPTGRYPTNTLVVVDRLVLPDLLIEITPIAAL
ncbi:MAG: RidA family protein [Alphaproteobacteria bacterium]